MLGADSGFLNWRRGRAFDRLLPARNRGADDGG
jgi:hypothetical protein